MWFPCDFAVNFTYWLNGISNLLWKIHITIIISNNSSNVILWLSVISLCFILTSILTNVCKLLAIIVVLFLTVIFWLFLLISLWFYILVIRFHNVWYICLFKRLQGSRNSCAVVPDRFVGMCVYWYRTAVLDNPWRDEVRIVSDM